ncbi:MAG: tyrosine-type recombinase/integrase [Archangium sp.]|nr:tyrosine-type recombinase/integrase [Archangium sp.]
MSTVFRERDAWVIKWRDAAGNWKKQRTQCATKLEAKKLAQQLEHRADLQRHHLAPMDGPSTLTFAQLLDWYDEKHAHRVKSQALRMSVEKHLKPKLGPLPLVDVTSSVIDDLLGEKSRPLSEKSPVKPLSPKTLNHLRAFIHRLFVLATKAKLWNLPNPAAEVSKRKEPKRPPAWLRPEEVTAVLPHVNERWRAMFAAAVFTGMRRGELVALQKRDVDLTNDKPTIIVCRSWDSDYTKSGEVREVPVHPELVPFLVEAIDLSPSELVFPRTDGSMHKVEIDLPDLLRSAMARAGLVRGWVHKCRWCMRKGVEVAVPAKDAELRLCPTEGCGKRLWPVALKRTERFHDLRHTTATLLLKIGTPLAVVQKLVGHSDPKITTEIYGHLVAEDARKHLEQLSFSPLPKAADQHADEPLGLPVVPLARLGKTKPPRSKDFSNNLGGFHQSGRQDLNLRPLGPEGRSAVTHPFSSAPLASQALATSGKGASIDPHRLVGFPPLISPLTAPVRRRFELPEELLTVAEVAPLLRVCKATVYRMVKDGSLPAVHVLNGVRIRRSALAEFV